MIRQALVRIGYVAASALLFAAAVSLTRRDGTSWWHLGSFAVAPDLTMLIGARRAGRGRLSATAVPFYNAAHRLIGPAALCAAAVFFGSAALVSAAAWGGPRLLRSRYRLAAPRQGRIDADSNLQNPAGRGCCRSGEGEMTRSRFAGLLVLLAGVFILMDHHCGDAVPAGHGVLHREQRD